MSEQLAVGAAPAHTSGAAHVVLLLTYGQLLASMAHVASVSPGSQRVPLCVQTEAAQVHAAPPPAFVVHVWCGPQAAAFPH